MAAGKEQSSTPSRRRERRGFMGFLSGCWALFVFALFLAIGFYGGGFVRFANEVAQPTQPLETTADGIVVLTGDTDRIEVALSLLQEERANRLLISGVNKAVSEDRLRSLVGDKASLFDCCVDIDRAVNTIDNADKTANWAQANDAKSIILVTSAYHVPRAMKIFKTRMPDADIIVHAVNPPSSKDWWRDTKTLRSLMREYIKLAAMRTEEQAKTFGEATLATFAPASK